MATKQKYTARNKFIKASVDSEPIQEYETTHQVRHNTICHIKNKSTYGQCIKVKCVLIEIGSPNVYHLERINNELS